MASSSATQLTEREYATLRAPIVADRKQGPWLLAGNRLFRCRLSSSAILGKEEVWSLAFGIKTRVGDGRTRQKHILNCNTNIMTANTSSVGSFASNAQLEIDDVPKRMNQVA